MMKRVALIIAFLAAPVATFTPVHEAAAEECEAKSWNLSGQKKGCFSAKVVDLLCEVAGDCPPVSYTHLTLPTKAYV